MKPYPPKWLQRLRDRGAEQEYQRAAEHAFKLGEQGLAMQRAMWDGYVCAAGYNHSAERCPFHQNSLGMGRFN